MKNMILFLGVFLWASQPGELQAAYVNTPPIQISSKKDIVIENVHIENPNGDCIAVSESQNIIIRNSDIGPCKGGTGRGVWLGSSSNTQVYNNVIHDIEKQGISIEKGSNHNVHHNDLLRTSTAIYTAGGAGTGTMGGGFSLSYNYIETINGNVDLKGHAAIFNQVNGPNSKINCNKIFNSNATPIRLEDIIDIYASSGTKDSPIEVSGNRMSGGGGGINWNGGGIIIADGPGVTENVVANDNLVIDSGSYGIEVMTGSNIAITNNIISSAAFPGNYNGIYASNYYYTGCIVNADVIKAGKLYACNCNPINIQGNIVQYRSTRSGKDIFANVNANGTCSASYGPITNDTLASNNKVATIPNQYPIPSFDTVRPSCDGDAGANKIVTPKPPTVPEQCGAWIEKYNVVPYVSWGSTPGDIQPQWDKLDCNHQVCNYFKDKYGVVPVGTIGASPTMGTLPVKFQSIWVNPSVDCNKFLRPKCNDFFDALKKAGSCNL